MEFWKRIRIECRIEERREASSCRERRAESVERDWKVGEKPFEFYTGIGVGTKERSGKREMNSSQSSDTGISEEQEETSEE